LKKIFQKNLKKSVDIFAGLCYYILTGRDKSPPGERKETKMMNLTKLYVIEKATGEKLYFATETDRAYGYNLMKEYEKITSKLYVINL